MASQNAFVVVDPNDDKHIALERAIITSKFRNPRPKLLVFVATNAESVDMRYTNDNLYRDQQWFEREIREPIAANGLECEIMACWSSDWQKAIIQESTRLGVDAILLPVHAKANSRRFTFAESKWALLKNAQCPVVLIRPGANENRKVVLAAVNFQATRKEQVDLNHMIVEQGKNTAKNYGAEFHIVNAYRESLNYPDRGKLVNDTGVASDHIHVQQGYTDEVVSAIAKKVSADILVMGTLGQNGLPSARRGNTAERVIGAVDIDVMVYNEGARMF
ncbi:MAG: universal stress protein [Spongiibacteraceae bacterium]|nr:universal stress protein [Spongiibacteraceae bacterium]